MNKKVKEPFFIARVINSCLGVASLGLMLLVVLKDQSTAIFEILMFVFVGVMNFIAATISFSVQKKVMGNIYAVICTIFFVAALVLTAYHYIFL